MKKEDKPIYGVYVIHNTITNQYYIGASSRVALRVYGHLTHLKSGIHENKKLQEAFNQYGVSAFCFWIVKDDLSKNIALEIEEGLISKYDAHDNGYNQLPSALHRTNAHNYRMTYKHTLQGEFIEKYYSAKEAATANNVKSQHIVECRCMIRLQVGGFVYAKNPIKNIEEYMKEVHEYQSGRYKEHYQKYPKKNKPTSYD